MKQKIFALAVATFLSASLLQAQELPPPGAIDAVGDDSNTDRTPPRLSYIDGQVSFWRPGADDWTKAQINLPLGPGDALYAGERSTLELEIGPRAFVRAGQATQLGLENQEPDFVQFKVTTGNLAVDVRDIEPGHTIEIDTPNAVFAVEKAGYYRVDVSDTSSIFVARRGGRALVTPANGESRGIEQNEQVVVNGIETPIVESYAAADLDAWDRWNYSRTDHASETRSAQYVPKGVYGTRDLDQYGSWAETSSYGPVWTPHRVATDWAPYSDGRWVWDVSFGWTWVDNQPWGWAPSHYGRWVHVHNHWGWAPGPIIAAPVYAPAVVAFFGNSHVSVSVGLSVPSVGWVALGWGEPVVPWWGHSDYIGRPSWRGWGGPRVVNRTVINNTNIVNVNNINVYQNASVRNAVVAVREDRFGRGDARRTRIRVADVQRLEPVRGPVNVRPVSASLSPRRERGVRPAQEVIQRPVVASREPRRVEQALSAQGIAVRNQPVSSPRIVRGTRPTGNRAAQQAERQQAAPEGQPATQPRAGESGRRDARDAAREASRDNPASVDRAPRQAPVPPGRNAQPATREQATQPGGAASERRDARNGSREGNRANPPAVGRAARQAPVPPGTGGQPASREQATQPGGAASERRDARDQGRERDRANPPAVDRAARQAPASRPERDRSVERQQQVPAPPRAAAPEARPQPAERQRTERQPQGEPRVQQPAAPSRPQQARQRPQVEQPQRATRPEQEDRSAPVVRSQPQPKRQQEPVVRSRPESASRQQPLREAQPQRERMNQPQRAEQRQQAPAASAPRQQPQSAGDAPRKAPAKKNTSGSGAKQDRD